MLGFGLREDCYALMYAIAKLMPTKVLDLIYRKNAITVILLCFNFMRLKLS